MSDNLIHYFEALERLKSGRPQMVPKGTKITNDAVALEAGRGKGSIKKSRPVFAKLIEEIDLAAAEQVKGPQEQKNKLLRAQSEAADYRRQLDAALAREVSLLYELFEVKQQLSKLTGDKVLPLRPQDAKARQ
ncbi:hypothetical protein [Burkholderia vietnamiensis]|uniref:hypothetical protein n=1 Tax=Burkholderia vietnamiensis TaxID=60552 RepID=UPI001592F57D|nr:hypothetical protein [Burkholderia vietnamiensis]